MAHHKSTTFGLKRADSLLAKQVRKASETRGFAQSRVLTHWEEIVGEELAAMTRPIEVRYGRLRYDGQTNDAPGGKLVVLTRGAFAPMLEMRKQEILDRINAVYGYTAIRHIILTQTAPKGFSEGQVDFVHRRKQEPKGPEPEAIAAAHAQTEGVSDEGLRAALERLGANVISKAGRANRH